KVPLMRWFGTALVATGIMLVLLTSRPPSVFAFGRESRSRPGRASGQISDGQAVTISNTDDGKPAPEDWFAVATNQTVRLRRVVYAHGRTEANGGWFDASLGKPRIQVQRVPGGPWQTVGVLGDYPSTTGGAAAGLEPGQEFTLVLDDPADCV